MKQRIEKVQQKLREQKIDGLLVTDPVNIRYLTGFVGADSRDAYILLCRDTAYFLTSALYPDAAQKFKDQSPASPAGRSKFKTFEINHENKLSDRIKEIANPPAGGERIETLGFEENNLTVAELKNLVSKLNGFIPAKAGIQKHLYRSRNKFGMTEKELSLVPTQNLIEDLRMIKDEEEIAALRKAAKLTDETFSFILSYLKNLGDLGNLTESQLVWEVEKYIREQGGQLAFSPIVAFGQNSANPHHVSTRTVLSRLKGQSLMVLLDFGASVDGYCADMTRIIFIGNPTEKQKKIYQTVLRAQKKALEYFSFARPGLAKLSGKKVDESARRVFEKSNLPLYPHSLGHGVGLQIHEGFRLSHKKDFVLKPTMVFTIEPGYYETGWGGIRIEDTVLLRDNTVEILTKSSKKITVVSS